MVVQLTQHKTDFADVQIGLQITPVGSFFTLIPCISSQEKPPTAEGEGYQWICRM